MGERNGTVTAKEALRVFVWDHTLALYPSTTPGLSFAVTQRSPKLTYHDSDPETTTP